MPGCQEHYHGAASQLLKSINHNALVRELENQASKIVGASSESRIFYSSTNPAPIITMKGGKFSAVPAMAIENGKVLKTGTLDEVRAAATSAAISTDLKSTSIVPGFVEPHVHVITSAMLEGFLLNCDPLNPAIDGTFEGAIACIKQAAQELKKGAWLIGYGYDPSRLSPNDQSFPDLTTDVFNKYDLNDHPTLILNASGHIAYANTPALTEAGITDHPSGVLIEPDQFQPVVDKALPSKFLELPIIVEGFHKLFKNWSSKGFTTVFDAGVGLSSSLDALILSGLAKLAPMQIQGAAANMVPNAASKIVGEEPMPSGGATELKIKTIKLWMDGSTQGFTGALESPYYRMLPSYFSNSPNGWARWQVNETCKITPLTDFDIGTEMQKWASRGYQLMVHVNGDCATEVVLKAFENLQTPDPKVKHRLEHFTVTNQDQVQRAAKLNLSVSHTIGHVKYWGHTFNDYILGEERAQRIDPVRDDVDSGVVYSFNSDSPVSQADGLSFVRTAATRLLYEKPEVVLGPSQTVTIEQALAGITINPARQILSIDEIGTLEEGKNANFVVLKHDISSSTIDAKDISSDWVLETWFQGDKKYTNTSI